MSELRSGRRGRAMEKLVYICSGGGSGASGMRGDIRPACRQPGLAGPGVCWGAWRDQRGAAVKQARVRSLPAVMHIESAVFYPWFNHLKYPAV